MTRPQKHEAKRNRQQDLNQGHKQQGRDRRVSKKVSQNQKASQQGAQELLEAEVATGTSIQPRLLPWPGEDGKPCYLVSGADGGYLSRLADDMEAEQLETGAQVLGHARRVLDDAMSPYTEIRYAGIRLAECLSDALRVAESRGLRLPAPGPDPEPDPEPEPTTTTSPARTGRTAMAAMAAKATRGTAKTDGTRPTPGNAPGDA